MADLLRVHDDFTDTAGTLLQAHTPPTAGTGWTAEFTEGTPACELQITVSGTANQTTGIRASQRLIYSAQPHPSHARQRVEARFTATGPVDDPWILFVRAESGNWGTGYGVACYAGSTKLFKKVTGTATELASVAAVATGSIVGLSAIGSTITVTDDGVQIISVTDTSIAQGVRWGIAAGDVFVATDDIDGQEFDAFKAWDVETSETVTPGAGSVRLAGWTPSIYGGSGEALAPTGLISATNLRDTLSASPPERFADIDEPIASDDGEWWTAVDVTLDTDVRLSFPPATGRLIGQQTINVRVRKTNDATPSVTLRLWQDGVELAPTTTVPITSLSGQIVPLVFDASDLNDDTGGGVEIRITGTSA